MPVKILLHTRTEDWSMFTHENGGNSYKSLRCKKQLTSVENPDGFLPMSINEITIKESLATVDSRYQQGPKTDGQ